LHFFNITRLKVVAEEPTIMTLGTFALPSFCKMRTTPQSYAGLLFVQTESMAM
jgi:hypothetical protein